MPAKGTKKITEQLFKTVIAQLKMNTGKESVARIAAVHGIKPGTVAAIRQAGTWKEWQDRKARKQERIRALRSLDKITQGEQLAKKATAPIKVPKPTATVTRQNIRPTTVASISRTDLNLALKPLLERISTLETAFSEMQADSIKSDIQDRRTFMARFRRGQR